MPQLDVEAEPAQTSEHSAIYRLSGWLIGAEVFAANIYPAVNQSITADEAFTYDDWTINPFHWILTVYKANNHVLIAAIGWHLYNGILAPQPGASTTTS
jgi:hypothetical protein